jgi:hypothetical protein
LAQVEMALQLMGKVVTDLTLYLALSLPQEVAVRVVIPLLHLLEMVVMAGLVGAAALDLQFMAGLAEQETRHP